MKKTIVATVLVSLSVLTSCSDDALVNAGKGTLTLQTSTEPYTDVQSRTQVGGMNADGSLGMYWTPDDKISVYGGSQNNVAFTNVNTEAGVNATFSGTFNGTPEYAFYPYSEKATTLSAIPVEIPTEQTYTDESSIANYDIKGGSISKTDNGAYTINFSQLASLVRFEIDLSGVEGLELVEGETLESVQLHATKTLTGDFTVDVTNKGLTAGTTATSSLTITFAETPALTSTSETIVAYAVVAPGTHTNEEWECDITTSHHRIQFYTTVKADLVQGTFSILPLNATVLKASHHYDNGEEVSGPYIETLGEEEETPDTPTVETPEPANCYMVSAAGTYVFDATVIGNGEDGIIADAGFHTTTATIVPKSVELLWQDTQNFITAVSLDESTGIVSYTTGGNVGNAQIAVKDDEGTILWSWHIWGTGDIAVSDDEYTNQAGATFTVMDRNLGQLKMIRSTDFPNDGTMYVRDDNTIYSELAEQLQPTYYCTYYQWGRKDPIPGTTEYYDIQNNVIDDISSSYPVTTHTIESDATIQYSVAHPNVILNASSINSGDWQTPTNQYLWGDNNNNTLYTWYSDGKLANENAGTGWTNVKTIYDPCPTGYRVANKWTFTGFVTSATGTSKFSSDDTEPESLQENIKCVVTYFNDSETTRYVPVFCKGYFFMGGTDDSTGAYYPMSGCRQGTDGSFSGLGELGYNWSSSRNSTSDTQTTSNHLSIGAYNWYAVAPSSAYHGSNNGSVNVVGFSNRIMAMPVRCVREN